MSVAWLTLFFDVPDDRYQATEEFWTTATGTSLSARRGDAGEFVTMLPPTGDAHLRMQVLAGEPRLHLDLHVDSVPSMGDRAVRLGATELADDGHLVMRSPGGFVFCLVPHHGEQSAARPLVEPAPHRPDQVSIDVPAELFDAECRFWADLTGWDCTPSATHAEFARLAVPDRFALTILMQKLGTDDPRAETHAHLDISCGDHRHEVAAHHRSLGADLVEDFVHWTVLRDPAGLLYCVTDRPVHGAPPPNVAT